MQDNRFHTFKLPSRTLEQVEPLGVKIEKPRGEVEYSIEKGHAWKLIGWVLVHVITGQIAIQPHEGLTEREFWYLIGGAENAFRNPPSEATGWARESADAEWWEGGTMITVDPDEAAAALVAAATGTVSRTPVTTLDIDAPIDLVPTEKAWGV